MPYVRIAHSEGASAVQVRGLSSSKGLSFPRKSGFLLPVLLYPGVSPDHIDEREARGTEGPGPSR
ncbi:protein of unknown function [Streptantibioticus cattleyicolor NRRL 8057 = DSM 46488]|nr:protein of unknown function [Streptantibioticus cattleyicolor NRRL 8057 = DSM 46488]